MLTLVKTVRLKDELKTISKYMSEGWKIISVRRNVWNSVDILFYK